MGRGPPSFVNHPLSARTVKWSQRPIRGSMQTPDPFDLALTVRSHGFYDLAPWAWDGERRTLARPLALASGRVVDVEVAEADRGLALRVLARGRPSTAEAREARAAVRAC